MNDINKKDNNIKKDKRIYLILAILSVLLIAIGSTYAYLIVSGSGTLVGKSQCYDVIYTNGQEIEGNIEKGNNYLSGTSTNIKMYSKPECASMTGTLYITTNSSSTMDLSDNALMYTVLENDVIVAEGSINGKANQIIYTGFALNQTETTYKVYVWLNSKLEDTTNPNEETYSGYIHAEAVVESEIGPSLLTLNNLGLTRFLNSGTPNFSTTATTDEGIFEAKDNLGTSYYFRGASINNYVKFAGFYWRIIRINGDGTVRMIYDGTQAYDNGVSTADRLAINMSFNKDGSNGYVGYMYGSELGISYEKEHANEINSAVKTYLEDTWYANNIKGTDYEQYLADAIYCNDRELYTGDGYGNNNTEYKSKERLRTGTISPSLICNNIRDKFTVYNGLGNGKLKYPIGLITADEIIMAGTKLGTTNTSNYLYIGNTFWSMTPHYFTKTFGTYIDVPIMFDMHHNGGFDWSRIHPDNKYGVRPVISLKADALKYNAYTSNGSKNYPFTVTGKQN